MKGTIMLQPHPGHDTAPQNLTSHQQSCLAALTSNIEQMNITMRQAVEAGLSIELRRASRHHQAEGNWGDIIKPTIIKSA
jgi:hypothetical protein